MSVKFKCSLSGNIYEFHTEHDIATMREHPDYEEVEETEVKPKKTVDKPSYNNKNSNKKNTNNDDE